MVQFFIKMGAVIAAAYFAVELPQVGGLTGWLTKFRIARARGVALLEHAAGFHEQLGFGAGGFHHSVDGAMVVGLVSGRGTGRRQLYSAADAGFEIGERFAGRRACSSIWRIIFCGRGPGYWWRWHR